MRRVRATTGQRREVRPFSHRVLFPSMMAFFSTFDSPLMRFTPRVEDTFTLYRNTLIGMVIVFQIPTLVFVLARMRVVTARWTRVQPPGVDAYLDAQ